MWFWWGKFFSNSIKSLSHCLSINFYYWTPFLFFSFKLFIYQHHFSVFWPVWPLQSLESSLAFHLVSEFLFFVLFRMLWMLVTVDKAKFSLRKTLITFNEVLALTQMLFIVYKSECRSLKTLINLHAYLCPLTSAIIIFSKAHDMSCFHSRNFRLESIFVT